MSKKNTMHPVGLMVIGAAILAVGGAVAYVTREIIRSNKFVKMLTEDNDCEGLCGCCEEECDKKSCSCECYCECGDECECSEGCETDA